jgi:hypothetical protein
MNQAKLVESLVASVGEVPGQVDVIGLQQYSLDDMQERSKRFLSALTDKEQRALDRDAWENRGDHSLLQLSLGSRAVMYHASGAIKYVSGLAPMEALFEKSMEKAYLTRMVEETARGLNLQEWAGKDGTLAFERLWQTKAQGFDRSGAKSEPVLCRVVGAYRHFVAGVPVLGAASVALKMAGNGKVDSMAMQVRASAAELVDKARIVNPALAATQISTQLSGLLGYGTDMTPADLIESQTMRFGYVDLGKRKSQRMLAPAYVAQVVLRHKEERQAYVFAVAASEKTYLPICQCGDDAPAVARRPVPVTTTTGSTIKRK